jgi:hypothetical protein
MKLFSGFAIVIAAIVAAAGAPSQLSGQVTIASEDFDGGAVNLISGFDPATENLDGGGGDWYGVGNIQDWPQVDGMGMPLGVPFNLIDDSATVFPTDIVAVWSSLTSDMTNDFFAISDTREWTDPGMGGAPLVASWVFDISTGTDLQLSIDMGQQANGDAFGGFSTGYVEFEYSIDGGPFVQAIRCEAFDATGSGFMYRVNDIGVLTNAVNVCQATGPNPISKISVEDGSVSDNTILDKCPPDGAANAGQIDSFVTSLVGTGSTLELRMTTELPFDALAFDNIKIIDVGGGVPVVVPGESLTVMPGSISSGGLGDLTDSDNVSLVLFRDLGSTVAVTQFVLTSTSPTAAPSVFEFVLEGRAVSRPNVVQRIEFFNYVTNAFEIVDERNAVRNPPDLVVTVMPTGDLSRFVEPTTREIRTRVRYRADSPRAQFSSRTDQAVWMIQ